jgi:hypothetical protein
MAGHSPTSAANGVPRNELQALRLVIALSIFAICLTTGGFVFDLYVLVTHSLTAGHKAANIALLFLFDFLTYKAIQSYRDASVRRAVLRSLASSD